MPPPMYSSPQSSWVEAYGFEARDQQGRLITPPPVDRLAGLAITPWVGVVGALYIRYKNKQHQTTVTCRYDAVSFMTYLSLTQAASKGVWVHNNVMQLPYTIV